jgi:hypothetical protein
VVDHGVGDVLRGAARGGTHAARSTLQLATRLLAGARRVEEGQTGTDGQTQEESSGSGTAPLDHHVRPIDIVVFITPHR